MQRSARVPQAGDFAAGRRMARTGHEKTSTSGEQAAARGLCHSRGAGGHTQLAQDVRQMAMNGVVAHEDPLGDRLIVQAFGDEPQDLDFALRQLIAPA